jgi:2-polyprenyl-6-methoxyphenol hydroxylase-like FAD-dependent oxidoreductase
MDTGERLAPRCEARKAKPLTIHVATSNATEARLSHRCRMPLVLDQGDPSLTKPESRDEHRRARETFGKPASKPVLVVGAGPVGLVAAIRLRKEGVAVRVVEALPARAARVHSVVLHPRTLNTLYALGLGNSLLGRGKDVTRLAIYTDGQRRACLELPSAGPIGPGAKTVPEAALHRALVLRLAELGTNVEWQTSCVALEQDSAGVRACLARHECPEEAKPHLRPNAKAAQYESVDAELVVGADGSHSTVRERLGIDWTPMGPRRRYVCYEAPDERTGSDAHLVIHEGLGNSIYPLHDGVSRFSFEVSEPNRQDRRLQLRQLLRARLPWCATAAEDFEWVGEAEVTPGMAASLGAGRVWLTGAAAHSTGLLGSQSLNVGMVEANDLARRIAGAMDESDDALGPSYARQRYLEWLRLFGLYPSTPIVRRRAEDWVKRHITAVLPSLPATGDDLDDLLDQLRVASA